MKWYVYLNDLNSNNIKIYNVFNNYRFKTGVDELLARGPMSRAEFSKELQSLAMRCFWCKCEYEVVMTSWPCYINKSEYERIKGEKCEYRLCINPEGGAKIDVYDQLRLNWDMFVDYVKKGF